MKRVMFVCKKNSARSQMAEGFAKTLGQGKIEVTSSELEASQVRPEAIATMKRLLICMTTFEHPPRILFLYGSLCERSYSRLLAEEAARIISGFGAETRFFDPRDLPIHSSVQDTHPKVKELRELSLWSEGQVWSRDARQYYRHHEKPD